MQNPLLNFNALPEFAKICPEHVKPALSQLLDGANAALERVVSNDIAPDYDAMSGVLNVATERLGRAWGAVSHIHAVVDTPELRAAYTEMLPAVTEFFTRRGSDERLFAKYRALETAQGPSLSAPRQQALRHDLRDFVLGGAQLTGGAKERFAQIAERSAELAQQFSEHVMDATDGFAYYASEEELDGLPVDAKQAALEAAQKEEKTGGKLTLHFPSYFPVMQYAHSQDLRERMHRAYVTRASELGNPKHDNSAIMQELLELRQEEAQLLGYANYAQVSLASKMAQSPEQVLSFLRDLAERALPYAKRDLQELRTFAAQELSIADLQPWDQAYASEKLREQRYAFSDEELRQYFTEPRVLQGLINIIETLFDVKIVADEAQVWHPDARFYRIERCGELIGQFYTDLYARTGKRPGAWMDDVRGRWLRPDGQLQTPVAQIVCNFTPPLPGKTALLSHDDVTTLFHEFGHALHHMLTQVSDSGVAGISGVEWDAVELPSQFMENFCWEWEVLQKLTAHVETDQTLPRELFDKMLAAKNFQSGLQTMRQLEFSIFDMRLHAENDSANRISEVIAEVRRETSILPPAPFNRFQHSFSHIFAGGYSAGYYSYKWAEVLSADAWAAFEEAGVFDASTANRYRQEILERGGSRDAADNFKAFRGRAPTVDALLRHQGMSDSLS